MMDVRNFSTQETLKNGMQVTIRAIRADDSDAFYIAFKGLEESSIYLRFFGGKKDLSARELKDATDVDFERSVALVTVLQEEAGEKIIGVGRYFTLGNAAPPDLAEVAFTVEDGYHGLGIASGLLKHLTSIARQKGIREFYAEVLPENKGMLAVFSRSGLPVKHEYDEGVMHVALSLV